MIFSLHSDRKAIRRRLIARLLLLGGCLGVSSLSARAENVLEPPDTSSPRATIHSFVSLIEELYQTVLKTDSPYERRLKIRPKAEFLLQCFDRSDLAPSIADSKTFEAAVCLKEIFDRIELPPETELPDDEEAKQDELNRYRIPGTEITLVRITEGTQEGEWLFSNDTVHRASTFFEKIRGTPYKETATTKGLHKLYVNLQGWLIPTAWVDSLPRWAKISFLEHGLWQWLSLILFGALAIFLTLWTARLGRGQMVAGTQPTVSRSLVRFLFPLTWISVSFLLDLIFSSQIRFTGQTLIVIKLVLRSQMFVGGIAMVLMVVNLTADMIIHARQLRPGGIDGQLIRLGFRVLTFFLVAWLGVMGAEYMGIPVTPLIAGLGVSGLAVALAAQHTIENLIAGIVLFADKPVRVGDFCRFGDQVGTVEQIGLRSTRVRALDRMLISIPNADFAKMQLGNFTRRDKILLKTVLQLRYETTTDQLRFVLAKLRDLLKSHPRILPEPLRVRFISLGAYSLDIELFAFTRTSDWMEFLEIQEDVLLQVMKIVDEAGTGFAFPSAVEYQAHDVGIDPERGRRAEEVVNEWRSLGLMTSVGFAAEPEGKSETEEGTLEPTKTIYADPPHFGLVSSHLTGRVTTRGGSRLSVQTRF